MADPVPIPAELGKSTSISGSETDLSTRQSSTKNGVTFTSSGLEEHYKPIESYEGYHRYDPKFEWEPEEERKVVRRVC